MVPRRTLSEYVAAGSFTNPEGARSARRGEPGEGFRTRKLRVEIARILKDEGYIANFKSTEEEGRKVLRVYLKYSPDNSSPISQLKRISRPGCRVYVGHSEIPRVLGGLGINILTTPKGVMTGRQARKEKLGGEVLCEVY